MDLPREIDDYIKGSIEYTLGLPVSTNTLELKLRASEEAQSRLRDRYLLLQSRMKEKDQAIDQARVRSSLNFPHFMFIYMNTIEIVTDIISLVVVIAAPDFSTSSLHTRNNLFHTEGPQYFSLFLLQLLYNYALSLSYASCTAEPLYTSYKLSC